MTCPCGKAPSIYGKDGCKACFNAKRRAAYAANPEAKKAAARAYAAEHRDESRARSKTWREANPDCDKRRGPRAVDREKANAATRKWNAAHRDYHREWQRRNYQERPEEVIARIRRRRAARATAVTRWDPDLDRLADVEARHLCRLRGALLGGAWQVDHVVALRGESVSGLHNAFNLDVAPASYNAQKQNRTDGRFSQPRGWLTC